MEMPCQVYFPDFYTYIGRIERESLIWQVLHHKMCNILYPYKNLLLMFIMVLSLILDVQGQDRKEQNMPELPQSIHPSKGFVIIVLSIMFVITFLLLAYVKFCKVRTHQLRNQNRSIQNLIGSRSRFSGVDRQVIETLPFFMFSSLKGSKEGLECTVCLSKFEDTEFLRLLPKCKHAFHMNCIDKWLESNSTCPLCRYRVEAGDIKNLAYSLSSRFLRVPSNLTDDPNLEIFVQREPSHRGSSRSKSSKEELLLDQGGDNSSGGTKWKPLHMINHKIIISDVVTRSRWSDLNSSDLLSLNCEMLNDMCSTRFSPLESTSTERFQGTSSLPSTSSNEEENSFTALNPAEKRSKSEIANVPRFAEIGKQNRIRECGASSGDNESEERLWRIWLPIARRTVQRFARQERNSVEIEHIPLASNV